jgi:LysR family hydrogen peroxide-inducible transcriptional activator
MPTLRQLEYLIAVADTRHFRRAAERCGVSQPTLSAQLAVLEQRLGVRLIERDRQRVVVSREGEAVLMIARRIMADVREMRDLAAGGQHRLSGLLRLGLPHSVGPYLLPRILPRLATTAPELRFYVREEVPKALPEALQRGAYDLLITPLPVTGADLAVTPLFREPLYLVVPRHHRLAAKGEVRRADLAGEPVLALEAGHQLHGQVEALCEEFGAKLQREFEGTSLDTLRQMVAMGLGITFLPGLYVRSTIAEDDQVRAVSLLGRALFRTIGLVWRKASAQSDRYQALADSMKAAVRSAFPDFPAG